MALTLVTSDLIHSLDYSKLTGTIPTWNQDTTGNADTATLAAGATILATARNIGGVSFNGSAAIDLPGVNTAGNQNTSGVAATATLLATARNINSVAFDGSADITIADATKLPLAGGTLTGTLGGTSATFSGIVTGSKLVSLDGILELDDNGTHNGIINSPASLRINIDSDNGNTGESFVVGNNQTAINNSNVLFKVQEDGNVGIGTSSPSSILHAVGSTGIILGAVSGDNWQTAAIKPIDESGSYKGSLAFYTHPTAASAGSPTERMRITSAGNVGIGTTSPTQSKLVISGGTTGSVGGGDAGITMINKFDNPDNSWSILPVITGVANTGLSIRDNTDSADRLVINGSGYVGIGTTSPSAQLHVQTETDNAYGIRLEGSTNNESGVWTGIGIGGESSNTKSAIIFQDIGDSYARGKLLFCVNNDTNQTNASPTDARLTITSDGFIKASNNGSSVAAGSYHEMRTTDNARIALFSNNSSTLTKENGLDIIFTAASPNNSSAKFFVCEDSSAFRFIVYSNGNVLNYNGSYGQFSDIKLKENVIDATPKLDDLLKVKVKNFNFIGDEIKQIGVIAQELEEIFPSMIDESPDTEDREVTDDEGNVTTEKVDLGTTTKSVKYSVFTPMLIKAIQEQQAQIELLKQEVELLKQ